MVSRRTFLSSEGERQFTHIRSSPIEEFLPGLLIFTLDSLLIYDRTRKNLQVFIQVMAGISPDLYQAYFSQCNLLQLTMRQFDSNIHSFKQYFNQLSSCIFSYLQISSLSFDEINRILSYYSDTMKVPLVVNSLSTSMTLIGRSCIQMTPLMITIKDQTAYFYYPSITYESNLRDMYLGRCSLCQGTYFRSNDYNSQTSICGSCLNNFNAPSKQEISLSINPGVGNGPNDKFYKIQREESKTLNVTRRNYTNKTETCQFCERIVNEKFVYYCQNGCCICSSCWIDKYDRKDVLICPRCRVLLSSDLVEIVSKGLKLSERKVYSNTGLKRCERCHKMKNKVVSCQDGCNVCIPCWICVSESRISLECPVCFELLKVSIVNRLRDEFSIGIIVSLCPLCNEQVEEKTPQYCNHRLCLNCWDKNSHWYSRGIDCPLCNHTMKDEQKEKIKRLIKDKKESRKNIKELNKGNNIK